jgi:hypothetical protein
MIHIDNFSKGSLFNTFISNTIENEKYIIEKNQKKGLWQMRNKYENYYNILGIDSIEMVTGYAKKLLNIEFNSILISGLGMGVIPFICQEKCSIIDVVEIDSQVINITSEIGHLNQNVRIYNNDIYNFQPSINYDIILFDHWMQYAPENEMQILKLKYIDYCNPNGFITFPVHEQFLSNR